MTELILHHYDMSPYAEKVRLMFGLKDLAWRSVQIPIVMPKPDLTELTGGYRRTPTLQIGADIYCDTKICARALERLHPNPSLFPNGDDMATWGLCRQAEMSFMMVVTVMMGAGGVFDEAFMEDRKKMAPGVDFSRAGLILPAKLSQLRANLALLERQLEDGREFVQGETPGYADLAAYHPHMMLSAIPSGKELIDALEHVPAWMKRVAAIGHGDRSELAGTDALAIARDAKPAAIPEPTASSSGPRHTDGIELGESVIVLPEEVGSGAVPGELVIDDVHEIAVRRHGERVGEVVVHFPREEYLVVRAG
jgi:glutathione S-transferase